MHHKLHTSSTGASSSTAGASCSSTSGSSSIIWKGTHQNWTDSFRECAFYHFMCRKQRATEGDRLQLDSFPLMAETHLRNLYLLRFSLRFWFRLCGDHLRVRFWRGGADGELYSLLITNLLHPDLCTGDCSVNLRHSHSKYSLQSLQPISL